MTGDLLIAWACRVAALAVVAGSVLLARADQWLVFALVLLLATALLIIGGRFHLGHTRSRRQGRVHDLQTRTSPTRKDTTTA